MTGGSGDDFFGLQQMSDGPGIIADSIDLTEHNHIAISASGFGGGLTAGINATSVFERKLGGRQVLGGRCLIPLQYPQQDAVLQRPDGTQSSVITVAQVQPASMRTICQSSERIVTVGGADFTIQSAPVSNGAARAGTAPRLHAFSADVSRG